MIDNCRISQIKLYKIEVSFPAFVPEAVIIVGVTVEREMEPVLVLRVPLLLLNIPECPKASSDMVEHAV